METIKISKNKYNSLTFQGSKNAKLKEKKKVKEKNPKSDNENEGSNPTDEGSNSMKKVMKKGGSIKGAHLSVLILTRVFMLRINVSRIKWTLWISFLRSITFMY